MKSLDEIQSAHMRNPVYRCERERTNLAHEVAMRVIGYRVEHRLTQTALASQLGMKQPAIARLEAGDTQLSLGTLARLARELGLEFRIEITSAGTALTAA